MNKAIKLICKYLIYFVIIFQTAAIVVSIVNLIYDYITGETYLALISNVSWFIPQYYISQTGNLWNLIPLLLFIGITVFLFFKSSKYLLEVKDLDTRSTNEKAVKYVAMDIMWLALIEVSYIMFFCFNMAAHDYPPYLNFVNMWIYYIVAFMGMFILFAKFNINEIYQKNRSVTTYSKVKSYAVVNVHIALFVVVWNIWMHYFGDTKVSNPNSRSMFDMDMNILSCVIMNVMLFFVTLYYYFHVKKLNSDTIPCKHFLLKINLLQIIAIAIESGVILLNAFVFFKK